MESILQTRQEQGEGHWEQKSEGQNPTTQVPMMTMEEYVGNWARKVEGKLAGAVRASAESLGHMEEALMQDTRELSRRLLEQAAQAKADTALPRCKRCAGPLERFGGEHKHEVESRFGPITIKRKRGWCARCQCWSYPADALLGLSSGHTPGVQEVAALAVSKMPVEEASAVVERLSGMKLSRSTLDREAKRQGQKAQARRAQLDEQMKGPLAWQQQAVRGAPAQEAVRLVIEIDAWNIRERDQWGESKQLRAKGKEPERWHWVYTATCFQLSQRCETAGGRPLIVSRGYVATRGGIDELRGQLHAEAQRHGLGRARQVLVVADGAAWIWNLAKDRFPEARQRLDAYHAKEHLWAVANAAHGKGSETARQWIAPLLGQLDEGKPLAVINELEELAKRLEGKAREQVRREKNYFEQHQGRMDYAQGRAQGEPVGSGAIESTCRQYQVRFKRTGQYWSKHGDEALMSLASFWRNGRWHVLYPHVGPPDPFKN